MIRIFVFTVSFIGLNLSLFSQEVIKLDLKAVLSGGAGISYEHFWTKKYCSELAIRNVRIEDKVFWDNSFLDYTRISNVGRKWETLFSLKREMASKSVRHDLKMGIGMGYRNWYKVSDEYSARYELDFMKAPDVVKYFFFVPLEYAYNFTDHFGIGIFMTYLSFDSGTSLLLNVIYKL